MNFNKKIGNTGEDLAIEFLKNNNYKIIERNFKKQYGEIDIIAFDKYEKVLVLIEVKTSNSDIEPEWQMTFKKIKNFQNISYLYANNHPEYCKNGFRLDLIAINLKTNEIKHYKNIT
ncbi:MAG: YraN family protein [Minisyncoccia bacterium]